MAFHIFLDGHGQPPTDIDSPAGRARISEIQRRLGCPLPARLRNSKENVMEQVEILKIFQPSEVGLIVRPAPDGPGYEIINAQTGEILKGPLAEWPVIADIRTKGQKRLAAVQPDGLTAYLF